MLKSKLTRILLALAAVLGLVLFTAANAGAVTVPNYTHVNTTTSGAAMDAHDGQIIQSPPGTGLYYQFGTAYACGFQFGSGGTTPYCGVNLYSSPDLVNWTLLPQAITPAQVSTGCDCFEPRVVQRSDGTFVMWLNANNAYDIFTAPAITGPYTLTATWVPPSNVGFGAEDVYIDPTTGTGWLAYTVWGGSPSVDHQIRLSPLDSTLTAVQPGILSIRMPLQHTEAPAVFRHGADFYITFSNPACVYCNNAGTGYFEAPTMDGSVAAWAYRGIVWSTSCSGQPDEVNPLTGSSIGAALIYQSDRWVQLGGHGDPNQTAAPTYLAPIVWTGQVGTAIPTQACYTSFSF